MNEGMKDQSIEEEQIGVTLQEMKRREAMGSCAAKALMLESGAKAVIVISVYERGLMVTHDGPIGDQLKALTALPMIGAKLIGASFNERAREQAEAKEGNVGAGMNRETTTEGRPHPGPLPQERGTHGPASAMDSAAVLPTEVDGLLSAEHYALQPHPLVPLPSAEEAARFLERADGAAELTKLLNDRGRG